jgi:hypothetical protein
MARDGGKLSVRSTDQAVCAPEDAERRFSELVCWAILPRVVGGSAAHLGNVGSFVCMDWRHMTELLQAVPSRRW